MQETKKRNKTLQTQVRTMLDERTDFLVQLQDRRQEINTLRKSLGITEKTEEDVDSNTPKFSISELRELITERDDLKAKLNATENELKAYKPEEIETGTPCQEERFVRGKFRLRFHSKHPKMSAFQPGIRARRRGSAGAGATTIRAGRCAVEKARRHWHSKIVRRFDDALATTLIDSIFVSVFVSYLLSHVRQAFRVVPCHPSLRWLCLLVLVANLPFERIKPGLLSRRRLPPVAAAVTMTNAEQLAHSTHPQYLTREIRARDVWFIK